MSNPPLFIYTWYIKFYIRYIKFPVIVNIDPLLLKYTWYKVYQVLPC